MAHDSAVKITLPAADILPESLTPLATLVPGRTQTQRVP